jgi:cell division protein ZapA
MAQITVRINGYAYTLGCEDGQEAHLQAMAEQVEGRINSIKALGSQSGETKLLVLAALLMADELHDRGLELAEARRGGGQKHERNGAPAEPKADPALARTLARLAKRAEDIAATLDHP